MRTKILLFTILFFSFNLSYAHDNLVISDPLSGWSSTGTIDSATLSIKPKGAFFECGLYLDLSLGQTYYSDTTEIVLDFELPAESFITDSWLWVGNQIVKADLMDRGRATMIYEGIVKRRQDPSLLLKNSATSYQLRVFPLASGEKRKVKITYLVPAKWANNHVLVNLPLNILKSSTTMPALKIIAYEEANFKNPALFNQPTLFQYYTPDSKIAQLLPNILQSQSYNSLMVSYSSPMINGIFAAVYETAPNEGYYQIALQPSAALNLYPPRKIAFLLEHQDSETFFTPANLYAGIKAAIYNT